MAASLWDAVTAQGEDLEPLADWLRRKFSATWMLHIPEGKAHALGAADMFAANNVLFKTAGGTKEVECASAEQAELVAALAGANLRGDILLPEDSRACRLAAEALTQRLAQQRARFAELAAMRAGDKPLQEKIAQTLMQWATHGRD